MVEKRMLIVDAVVARKIDENRGELGHSDFLNFLIDNQLKEDVGDQNQNHNYRSQYQSQDDFIIPIYLPHWNCNPICIKEYNKIAYQRCYSCHNDISEIIEKD